MMITLMKNEIIKLASRRKTLVMLIAFIALTALLAFGNYKADEQSKKAEDPQYRITQLQNSIDGMNKTLKQNPDMSESDKTSYQSSIKGMEDEIKSIKENPKAAADWKESLKNTIDNLEKTVNDTTVPAKYKEEAKLTLQTDKYLLQNNIKPVNENTLNAFNFIKILYIVLGAIFLAVGVAVFSSDMVSGEYTPATAKFLLTQPVSRAKVLLSKFITAVLASVVLIGVIEITAFLVIGLVFGFGNLNYPQIVGAKFQFDLTQVNQQGLHDLVNIVGTAHTVPMWQYLIMTFLMQLLFIVACTSFSFLLSTVLKSSMVAMSVSIVTVIAVTILQNFSFTRKIASFIFILYGNVNATVSGTAAQSLSAPYATTGFVIGLMLVWTVVCYVIAHVVFVKRDLLV